MKQILTVGALIMASVIFAAEIALPAPDKQGGEGLYSVLAARRTVRSFETTPLTLQQLSNLLWCANGVSSDDGKRTAPSARNRQEIDIYCLLPEGAYFYDAVNNKLVLRCKEDLREAAGPGRAAACYLVLVADASRQASDTYGKIDVGYVSQNIYLFCQASGLATCAMGMIGDRPQLISKLGLGDSQLLLVHPVGAPKK